MLTSQEYNEIFDKLHNNDKLEEDTEGNKYIEIHEMLLLLSNYVGQTERQDI